MNHVILVPGAWHGAWCFDKVVAELRARGVAVTALNMPGHGGDPEPLGGLEADVASTRNAIQRVGGPVVLLGHSYGGAVITEAAVDPATAARVKHLVYLAAFAPGAGESVGYWSVRNEGSTLRALIRKSDTTEAASVVDTSDFAAAKEAFYADCSDDDVRSAAGQLCPQRTAGLSTPLTGEPWRTLPTTYVVCTEDRAIPVATQWEMAARITDANPLARIVAWKASHSPFYSRPASVADVCEAAARA